MPINSKWLLRHTAPWLLPLATIALIVRDYMHDHGPTGLPNDLPNLHNKPGELPVFLVMVIAETIVVYWLLYPREEALWWRALAGTALGFVWSLLNGVFIVHAGGIMALHLFWMLLLTLGCFVTFIVAGLRTLFRRRDHRSARTA